MFDLVAIANSGAGWVRPPRRQRLLLRDSGVLDRTVNTLPRTMATVRIAKIAAAGTNVGFLTGLFGVAAGS